ncbi:MAG: heavy metal translocating P-type ATPase [Myxococcales bacterium]|jgi:Cu2+-exporting ATPase
MLDAEPTVPAREDRTPEGRAAVTDARVCTHCRQPLSADQRQFCCFGCRAVHEALRSAGLTRFYELRGGPGEPIGERELGGQDHGWLEPLQQQLASGDTGPLRLRAQGLRCAACVWVFERSFAALPEAGRIRINPATGLLEIEAGAGFPLGRFVEQIERFGYRLGLAREGRDAGHDEERALLLRLGVCSALAMNAMFYAAAIHLGLREGALFSLLHGLSYGAAMLAVLVGGPVFIGSAARALRAGVLHLDVPIAAGILLTTAAAAWAYFGGYTDAAYFDSLAIFVALMLGGRYLQERAVAKNRRELLDDPSFDELRCQRERALRGKVTLQTASYRDLSAGDVLLLAPGELLPVRGAAVEAEASLSLDWINGESEPRNFPPGETIPAGAFNAGMSAVRVRLLEDFAASDLLSLLGSGGGAAVVQARLQRFSSFYVIAVLALATAGLAGWTLLTGDPVRGLSVATAVCVVTCPCAIGIAIPLAYELAHGALRRRGLFVREGSLLDRLPRVRRIVFDKTGTLTTGRLRVRDPQAVRALPRAMRDALYQLCARSRHPRSVALRRLLEDGSDDAPTLRHDVQVRELPGRGLEAHVDGSVYRLGRHDYCVDGEPAAESHGDRLCLSVDGAIVLELALDEELRPDAAREVESLQARGYAVHVLSGDAPERVATVAAGLGLPADRALGGLSPDEKAAWIDQHGAAETLMIGDGINDSLAVDAALCSGTPAVDRAFLPARTDFHFTTAGLAPVGAALHAADDLSAVVRGNLIFAVAYNAGAVALSLGGLVAPWLAAVVMPLSSVAVVARTSAAVTRRSRLWKC